MDNRIISIGVLVVLLVGFVGGFIYLNVFYDDGEEEEESYDAEGAENAAQSFVDNYTGGFAEKEFTVETGDDYSKAYYISSGMSGDTEYYVKFVVYETADEALEMYETQQALYAAKVGPSAMSGLTYYACEDAGSLDNGYGYYGVCSMTMGGTAYNFVTLHYTGCIANLYVEASLYDSDGTLETAPIADAVDAISSAFE